MNDRVSGGVELLLQLLQLIIREKMSSLHQLQFTSFGGRGTWFPVRKMTDISNIDPGNESGGKKPLSHVQE